MKEYVWFYSYAWQNSDFKYLIEDAISYKHPFLIAKKWHKEFEGNNRSRIISFQKVEVTEDIRDYVKWCLDNNAGEFGGGE